MERCTGILPALMSSYQSWWCSLAQAPRMPMVPM
eukprot:gene28338-35175_t